MTRLFSHYSAYLYAHSQYTPESNIHNFSQFLKVLDVKLDGLYYLRSSLCDYGLKNPDKRIHINPMCCFRQKSR